MAHLAAIYLKDNSQVHNLLWERERERERENGYLRNILLRFSRSGDDDLKIWDPEIKQNVCTNINVNSGVLLDLGNNSEKSRSISNFLEPLSLTDSTEETEYADVDAHDKDGFASTDHVLMYGLPNAERANL